MFAQYLLLKNIFVRQAALLVVSSLCLFFNSSQSFAEESVSKSNGNVSASAQNKSKSVEDNNKEKAWTLSLNYGVSSDFADQLQPRIYTHNIGIGAGYDFKNIFLVDASLGYFFKSLNTDVSRYPEDSGFSSLSMGVSKDVKMGKFLGAEHTFFTSLSGEIPFTEESQLEGYRGSIGILPQLKSAFFTDKLIVRNSANYNIISNRYRFSPSDGGPTAKSSYGAGTSLAIKIYKKLYTSVGVSMRRTEYTDGFHDFQYNNKQSISYSFEKISLALSHSNGGYTDDGKAEIWYIDRYHRIVTASIGYSF